jgi:hypothetical protein
MESTKQFSAATTSIKSLTNFIKNSYVVIVLTLLGLFALATAILVAWPALAYFASIVFI